MDPDGSHYSQLTFLGKTLAAFHGDAQAMIATHERQQRHASNDGDTRAAMPAMTTTTTTTTTTTMTVTRERWQQMVTCE